MYTSAKDNDVIKYLFHDLTLEWFMSSVMV